MDQLAHEFDKMKDEIAALSKKLESIKEEKLALLSDEISGKDSDLYKCPVLKEIMVYPVTLYCGHTFERHAINEYLNKTKKCPLCAKDTSHYEALTICTNILVCDIIDRKYPGYRSLKIKHDITYAPPVVPKNIKEAFQQKGRTLNQAQVDRAVAWMETVLDSMLKNGWTAAEIGNPSPADKEIAELMAFNTYVKEQVNKRLDDIGYAYNAEWKNVEVVREREVETDGRRKRVRGIEYVQEVVFISIAPKK